MPLVQLVEAAGAPYDLEAAGDPRTYADLLTPCGARGTSRRTPPRWACTSTSCCRTGAAPVDAAHAAGLAVHAWTVRDENRFLAERYRVGGDPEARGDAPGRPRRCSTPGVDGIFTDHADTAVRGPPPVAGAGEPRARPPRTVPVAPRPSGQPVDPWRRRRA